MDPADIRIDPDPGKSPNVMGLLLCRCHCLMKFDDCLSKQASSFFNKNLTNADNDSNMNISTKMDMGLVNKGKGKCIYTARFFVVPHTQGAQAWITSVTCN